MAQAVNVVCVGDSLTHAFRGEGYPCVLQRLLSQQHPNQKWCVKNEGMVNAATTDWLSGHLSSGQFKQTLAGGCDVVVIMLGTNDCRIGESTWMLDTPGQLQDIYQASGFNANAGFNEQSFCSNLTQVVRTLMTQVPNASILLATPPPIADPNTWAASGLNSSTVNTVLPRVVPQIAASLGIPCIDCFSALGGAMPKQSCFWDGIHLSQEGESMVASAVLPVLLRCMSSKSGMPAPAGVTVTNNGQQMQTGSVPQVQSIEKISPSPQLQAHYSQMQVQEVFAQVPKNTASELAMIQNGQYSHQCPQPWPHVQTVSAPQVQSIDKILPSPQLQAHLPQMQVSALFSARGIHTSQQWSTNGQQVASASFRAPAGFTVTNNGQQMQTVAVPQVQSIVKISSSPQLPAHYSQMQVQEVFTQVPRKAASEVTMIQNGQSSNQCPQPRPHVQTVSVPQVQSIDKILPSPQLQAHLSQMQVSALLSGRFSSDSCRGSLSNNKPVDVRKIPAPQVKSVEVGLQPMGSVMFPRPGVFPSTGSVKFPHQGAAPQVEIVPNIQTLSGLTPPRQGLQLGQLMVEAPQVLSHAPMRLRTSEMKSSPQISHRVQLSAKEVMVAPPAVGGIHHAVGRC